tara:strand:+ start:86 stop:505 length:420 start_codon:yes stop_codon:yes gene_type:complete
MEVIKINQEHRSKMEAMEAAMSDFDEVELKCEHYFAHGTYTRVLHLPKDTILTGKIHRYSCINIIAKGKIRAVTDDGDYDIEAPFTFVSGPGVKKAGYALEETVWINVHPWVGAEDVDLIERELIIPSYEALEREQEAL